MRKLVVFAAVLLVVVIAGAVAIYLNQPATYLQAQVLGAVEKATGGKATAGASPTLSLFPRPALEIGDLSLSGITQAGSLRDARAKRLAVEAEYWPLLSGRAVISRLAIEKPVITLAEARAGAGPQAADGTPAASGTVAFPVEVRKFEITDGRVVAEGSEQAREFSDIKILAEFPSAAGPLAASFAFILENEKVEGTGTIFTPDVLLGTGPTRAVASAASKQGKFDFDGELSIKPDWQLSGTTKIETPSLRNAAKWLGADLPRGGLGEFSLGGKVRADANAIALSEARITLDGNEAAGVLELDTNAPRPSLKANLAVAALDARPYLGTGGSAEALTESVAAAPEADDTPLAEIELVPLKDALQSYVDAPADGEAESLSLPEAGSDQVLPEAGNDKLLPEAGNDKLLPEAGNDKLLPEAGNDQLERAAPREAAFDFAPLKAADIDVKLDVGALNLGWGQFGPAKLATRIDGGALEIDVEKLAVEGGSVKGKVTLDARPPVPVVGATLQMSDVESEAIITRLAGKGVLSGKASGEADLTSRGATLNQILDQLSGKLSVKVVKGTVIGYDVRNMLLNWLNKYVYKKTVHTPFDGLDAAFTIDKGLARTSGIELTGPSISIMAKGAARLSTRQIDYRSRLSVVPPPKGYGIPVRITGLWTGPKVRPDVWAWISGSSGLESVAAASALPELKDPELDALLKRALEKAGPGSALDPDAALPLKVLSGELELEKN